MHSITTINDLFDSLVDAKSQELVDTVPEDRSRRVLAMVAYAVGAQMALELALLDLESGRRLVTAIHETQARSDPGSEEEFNQTALDFLHAMQRLDLAH